MRKPGIMCAGICHNCHRGKCLNGATTTLEDFDDPNCSDVVNLAEIELLVQIKENTEQDEQIAGPSCKKRSRVDCFLWTYFSL